MTTNSQRIQFLVDQEEGFTRSRLPALYSDFRGLRATNPDGYAANVAAWRRALASLVRGGMLPAAATSSTATSKPKTKAGSASASASASSSSSAATRNFLILTAGQHLLDALQSDRYRRPLALDAVVGEAVQERDFIPLESFLRSKESIYNRRSWASWAVGAAVGLPWHALAWGLRQAGVLEGGPQQSSASSAPVSFLEGSGSRLAPNQYVVVANLEEAAAAFMDKTAAADTARPSPFERVWSVAHFKRMFSAPGAVLDSTNVPVGSAIQQPRLSDMDLNVLLAFLARDKNTIIYDGHVVKLRAGTSSSEGITEEDCAVAQLRELIDTLSHQTTMLSRRIDDLNVAAKDALVVRKNRVAAMAALKQKKQAEAALTMRFATLAQLEATAAKIEQASDQVQVVQAMAASADALKSLNTQVGGTTGVEGVVDRLRDQMDAADEINSILIESGPTSTTAGGTGIVIDESEIDDELAALEKEEQRKVEAADQVKREAEKRKEGEEQTVAAEETRQRLDSAGAVPDKVPETSAAEDAAMEDETTESFRNLSLKSDEPQRERAG